MLIPLLFVSVRRRREKKKKGNKKRGKKKGKEKGKEQKSKEEFLSDRLAIHDRSVATAANAIHRNAPFPDMTPFLAFNIFFSTSDAFAYFDVSTSFTEINKSPRRTLRRRTKKNKKKKTRKLNKIYFSHSRSVLSSQGVKRKKSIWQQQQQQQQQQCSSSTPHLRNHSFQ